MTEYTRADELKAAEILQQTLLGAESIEDFDKMSVEQLLKFAFDHGLSVIIDKSDKWVAETIIVKRITVGQEDKEYSVSWPSHAPNNSREMKFRWALKRFIQCHGLISSR